MDAKEKVEMLHCSICKSTFMGFGERPLSEAWLGLRAHVDRYHPEVRRACEEAGENERSCPNRVPDCPSCVERALDADIPLSVILGRTRLRDHFDEERIALETGDIEKLLDITDR